MASPTVGSLQVETSTLTPRPRSASSGTIERTLRVTTRTPRGTMRFAVPPGTCPHEMRMSMATAADASQQYERTHHLTFTEVFGANVGGDQMLPDEVARALARGEARRIMDDAAALEAEAARVPPPQSQPRVLRYKKRTPPPLNLAMAGPLGTPQISPKLTQPNKGLTINAALANELQRRLNSPNGLQSGGPISPRTTSPIALSGYSDFRSRGGRLSSPPSRPASPRGSSPRGPSPIRITHLDLETEMRVETSAAATAIATSKMRFYILWAFSFCAIAGGASFNVLSPVSATIRRAYGWGDGYVTWWVRSSTNSPVELQLLSFSLIDNILTTFPLLILGPQTQRTLRSS